MQGYGAEWQVLAWSGIVGLAVVAAAAVHVIRQPRLPALPLSHAAAAALVAVIGWEWAIYVPGVVNSVVTAFAGIDSAPNQAAYQTFAVANVAVVVAAAVAVTGVVARWIAASVLAVGVCAARVATALIGLGQMFALTGQLSGGGDPQLGWLALSVVLQAVPAVAAIVLLAWPFARGRRSSRAVVGDAFGPGVRFDSAGQPSAARDSR